MHIARKVSRSVALTAFLVLGMAVATATLALAMTMEIPVLTPIACEVTGGEWRTLDGAEWAGPSCFEP
jgi:hypothetical protein